MKFLIPEMAALAARCEPFALATVITRNGSAPRSAGAKMLVRSDGSTVGTVGGGILEAQVETLAREILSSGGAVVRSFQFSGKDAATMDAICGGRVEVLVERIDPAAGSLPALIPALDAALQGRRKAWWVTRLPSQGMDSEHALVSPDASVLGELPADAPLEAILETRTPALLSAAQQRWMVEPLDICGTVYIFGAGHVSRSLAEFTQAVGFWTVVLDDRADYVTSERFPGADERIVLDSFENAFAGLPVAQDSFIVIVTRGHLNDRTVLAQALHTPAGYIGMIGSRRKCALVFEELRREGFSEPDLRRVNAPIGLPIQAETPEEIGVSIVAQMIQVRAALLKS